MPMGKKLQNIASKASGKASKAVALVQKSELAEKDKVGVFVSGPVLLILGISSLVMSGTNLGIKSWRAADRLALSQLVADAAGFDSDMREQIQAEYKLLAIIVKKCTEKIDELGNESKNIKKKAQSYKETIADWKKLKSGQLETTGGVDTILHGVAHSVIMDGGFSVVEAGLNAAVHGAGEFVPVLGTFLSAGGLLATLLSDDHRTFCDPIKDKVEILRKCKNKDGADLEAESVVDLALVTNLKEGKDYQPAVDCSPAGLKVENIKTATARMVDSFCLELYRNYIGYYFFGTQNLDALPFPGSITKQVKAKIDRLTFVTALGVMKYHTRAAYCNVEQCQAKHAEYAAEIAKDIAAKGNESPLKSLNPVEILKCAGIEGHGPRIRSSFRPSLDDYLVEMNMMEGGPKEKEDDTLRLMTQMLTLDPKDLGALTLYTKFTDVRIRGDGYEDISTAVSVSSAQDIYQWRGKGEDFQPDSLIAECKKQESGAQQAKDTILYAVRKPSLHVFESTPMPIKFVGEGRKDKYSVFIRCFKLSVRRYIKNWFDFEKGQMQVAVAAENTKLHAKCELLSGAGNCVAEGMNLGILLITIGSETADGYCIELQLASYIADFVPTVGEAEFPKGEAPEKGALPSKKSVSESVGKFEAIAKQRALKALTEDRYEAQERKPSLRERLPEKGSSDTDKLKSAWVSSSKGTMQGSSKSPKGPKKAWSE